MFSVGVKVNCGNFFLPGGLDGGLIDGVTGMLIGWMSNLPAVGPSVGNPVSPAGANVEAAFCSPLNIGAFIGCLGIGARPDFLTSSALTGSLGISLLPTYLSLFF